MIGSNSKPIHNHSPDQPVEQALGMGGLAFLSLAPEHHWSATGSLRLRGGRVVEDVIDPGFSFQAILVIRRYTNVIERALSPSEAHFRLTGKVSCWMFIKALSVATWARYRRAPGNGRRYKRQTGASPFCPSWPISLGADSNSTQGEDHLVA